MMSEIYEELTSLEIERDVLRLHIKKLKAEIDRLHKSFKNCHDACVRAERNAAMSQEESCQHLERLVALYNENEQLQKCCTQRGARMQIMRDWMEGFEAGSLWNGSVWDALCESRKLREPNLWFDKDGVPK